MAFELRFEESIDVKKVKKRGKNLPRTAYSKAPSRRTMGWTGIPQSRLGGELPSEAVS